MNERYRFWVDQVSLAFGLDMCAVQAVVRNGSGNEDNELIIDVDDSAFTLFGESQDIDRQLIADLVFDKMTVIVSSSQKTEDLSGLDNFAFF